MMQSARELRQALAEARDGRTLKGRRDALEKCVHLLKRPALQASLDANGDESSESQGITWEEVLDLADVVLTQTLQRSRGKDTAGTREERDAAVDLMDVVVSLSLQKGGRIRAKDVVQLIIPMLRDKDNRALVGRQLLRLLKQLLKAPHHQADLPSEYYNGLIKLYTTFMNQTAVFNPAEVAEMLHGAVKAALHFAEVDVALCAQFLESVISKLLTDRSLASTGLMLHVLGIWRILYEYYSAEYPQTFLALTNALLVPTAYTCHDNKDNHLEMMLFLIVGQVSLIKERSSTVSLLEWLQGATERALRGGRLRNNCQLREIVATALASCAAALMEDKDRYTLDQRHVGDGTSSESGSAPKRAKSSPTMELGVLVAFEAYQRASNDLGATGLWLAVVRKYVDKYPSTVSLSGCKNLITALCVDVLLRPLEVRAHLIDVLRSLLLFSKTKGCEPSKQVLDVLIRTLDANQCVDRVYSIIDLILDSGAETTPLRRALFRGHHEKSEEGMAILKKLCVQNQVSRDRFQPLEWIFGLKTNQLALKANIIMALCLKRTSCAFGPGKLTVECLPDVVDEVCHRLNAAMSGSVHFLYVAMLFAIKIYRVRNPSPMLEPLMVSVREAFVEWMREPAIENEHLSCVIEVLQDCRKHFVSRIIKFNFMPLVRTALTELKEKSLGRERTSLEMALSVDSQSMDEADCDVVQLDEELTRVSSMCRFVSLHVLVQCKSAEERRVAEARQELEEMLQIFRSFPEERLKGPAIARILALLVRPLLEERSLWTSDTDPLLEQVGTVLKTQLELTFNKPDLVGLIIPAIQDFILCAANVYNGNDTSVTALARKLLRRLVVSFHKLQSHNAVFGRAVLSVLTSIVDLDPSANWLYYGPDGRDRNTGCLELLVEYVKCPVFRVRTELAALLPAVFARNDLMLSHKKRLVDLMFDSYGELLQSILGDSSQDRRQTSTKVPCSRENLNEKLASSVTLFGCTLRRLVSAAAYLTGHIVASCCRLWRARILSDDNLMDLLRAIGDIDRLLDEHLAHVLVVWYKRFLLTLEMDETDASFPFFVAKDVRHFMSKFGHIMSPTLLLLGNAEARDSIRGVFGGSVATYFTPVAACCFLRKEHFTFFVELTRSLEVDKKMLEFLVPVYTRIVLALRTTDELDDCEITFDEATVAAALGRAVELLQATEGDLHSNPAEPWLPFAMKTVPPSRLPQFLANVLSSPQLQTDPSRCAGCLAFLVSEIIIPLAASNGAISTAAAAAAVHSTRALPTAMSMLFNCCCQLLLDHHCGNDSHENNSNSNNTTTTTNNNNSNKDNNNNNKDNKCKANVRRDCLPALIALLGLADSDADFLLVAPALAVAERLRDEQFNRRLFASFGAITDVVVMRPHGLSGSLSLEQIRLLIRSVYFYLISNSSPHPVRLLARILRHPEVRRVIFAAPSTSKDKGIEVHSQDLCIDDYPGCVLLATVLDRLKNSSKVETPVIFSCLDTLGNVQLPSWTLRPFLHEFNSVQPLPYLDDGGSNGAGQGIVVSFAQRRIVERLLVALLSGAQRHLNVVTDCLAELFACDIGIEIASSVDPERSCFAAHVAAFASRRGKRMAPMLNLDDLDGGHRQQPDIASLVARISQVGEIEGLPDEAAWFREVTNAIMADNVDPFLRTILPLYRCDEKFCIDIFPMVLFCVHVQGSGRSRLNELVSRTFAQVDPGQTTTTPMAIPSALSSKPSVKAIYTKLVQFVCLLHLHAESVEHINLMAVSHAACLCGLHECSLLLLTLWWERMKEADALGGRAPLAFHEYDGKLDMTAVQEILVRCSEALGSRDNLLGCFSRRANDSVVRTALGEASTALDILLEKGEFHALRDIVRLRQNHSEGENARSLDKYAIECAFRLGEWDQLVVDNGANVPSFREATLLGLTAISSGDGQLLSEAISTCTSALVSTAAKINLNIVHQTTSFLVHVDQVQLLQGYREARTAAAVGSCANTAGAWDGFVVASERRFKQHIPFEISEEYLWVKTAIFKTLPHLDVADHLLTYGTLAVQSSKISLARAALLQLEGLRTDGAKNRFAYLQAATQAHMDVNHVMTEQLSARLTADLAEKITSRPHASAELRARALLLRGRVLGETRRATPLDIAESYFKPAVEILQTCGDGGAGDNLHHERVRAYRELATFADDCARDLAEYFQSAAFREDSEYLAREGNIRSRASELEDVDVRNHKLMLRDIDQLRGQIQDKKDSLASLAVSALSNYLQVLRLAYDQNTKYRVFSLWYSHKDDRDLSRCLREPMEELTSDTGSIPVHGFADMFYQLAACMAIPSSRRADESFQRQLQQLVLRLSRNHPYHCVPTLLLLANPRLGRQAANGVDLRTKFDELEERGKAAKRLLDLLTGEAGLKSYIQNLEVLAAAYAELSADVSVLQGRGSIKKQASIVAKNRYFQELPILTSDFPVCPDGNYEHVERVKDFIQQYEICAGLSRPKKMYVRGNQGTCYVQLLKGKDDLRQDAVMQQLFKEVSRLRSEDGCFRVSVRTYKVVPLSRFVGVIEWVRNTIPLGSVLVGSKDALHEKYNPAGSLRSRQAHTAMQELSKAPSAEEKKARYLELCAAFPPAFRFFLLERFRDPVAWLERQRAYVNSLAITSMVGYIIGLGDRHTNNILVDCNTSEVVHIDLGIIFEQGKLLYTPELVPFRLTRDMVDGCGIFGVEGQFRATCERTLEILRNNSQLLIAIVEVILLHDPLALFSGKAKAAAGRNKDNPLKDGQQNLSNAQFRDRVLQRLLDKLKGIDEGHPLSVQGQVNVTIQQAVDPLRLAQIFHGWKPYL